MGRAEKNMARIQNGILIEIIFFVCSNYCHGTFDPDVTEGLGGKTAADDEKCAKSGRVQFGQPERTETETTTKE